LTLNRGPFPPPALPGFDGTMGLSDSPGGRACPSRASRCVTHSPPRVSRVAFVLPVQACRRHYPGGIVAGIELLPGERRRRPSPNVRWVGSRVNRFEACSAFTHVTACLLAESPDATLCIEGFGSLVTSAAASIATGWSNRCQVGLAPTEERHLYTAHGHPGLFLKTIQDV